MVATRTTSDGHQVTEVWVCQHLYKYSGMMSERRGDANANDNPDDDKIVFLDRTFFLINTRTET